MRRTKTDPKGKEVVPLAKKKKPAKGKKGKAKMPC